MANTLKLEIVTPEGVTYSEDVEMVTLPGSEGEMGIYPNHVPLMTQVAAGEVAARRKAARISFWPWAKALWKSPANASPS